LPKANSASVLVFYDWSGELNLKGWLAVTEGFFRSVGSSPNRATYRDARGNTRNIGIARLHELDSAIETQSLEVFDLHPPRKDFNSFRTYAGYNVLGRKKTAVFSYDCNDIDVDLYAAITQEFSSIAGSIYGHAFLRPISLGPVMYAYDLMYSVGVEGANDVRRAEERQVNLWREERLDLVVQNKPAAFRHLLGMLRDVFPMNVLTPAHVRHQVFGKTLAEWIMSSEVRGHLQEVSKEVWVWILPRRDLANVRLALKSCGMLISVPANSL
jgi:hypothetical protein